MNRNNETYTPASLQNVRDHQNRIEICCDECGHGKKVPLETLITRFGADYPVPELGRHFTCASCMMLDGVKRTGSARIVSR
jgi:hypothetical protein